MGDIDGVPKHHARTAASLGLSILSGLGESSAISAFRLFLVALSILGRSRRPRSRSPAQLGQAVLFVACGFAHASVGTVLG